MIAIVAPAFAAQVALQLDTTELREGQTVGLTLTVEDADPRAVPRLALPEGLSAAFSGKSTTQTIINFQRSLVTTYSYALTATAAGDYTLGPFDVQTSAGVLKTQALSLHVSPRAKSEADALVAELGADVAWLGQVLVYHARFTTPETMVNGQWAPPETDALRAEPSVQPATAEYEIQQDGQSLHVSELFYPVRASRVGKVRVPATSLMAQFAVQSNRSRQRDFFGVFAEVRNETYSSRAIELLVRDLPAEGRPKGFGGLVGTFSITRKASADHVAVGETVTVETVLEGDGSLAGFDLPPVEGKAFKVYADQPVVNAALDGGRYRATGTWKHAVVPLEPGHLSLPELTLSVFDPAAGAYTSVVAPPIEIDVSGAAASADVKTWGGAAKQGVDAIGEDILPVRTDTSVSRPLSPRWAFLLFAPGLALNLAVAARGLRARPRTEVVRRLDLADLPSDPEGRLAGMERILRERVGEKIGVPADAVRREDLARLGPLAGDAEALWRKLESIRYGGARDGLPEAELRALVERLV